MKDPILLQLCTLFMTFTLYRFVWVNSLGLVLVGVTINIEGWAFWLAILQAKKRLFLQWNDPKPNCHHTIYKYSSPIRLKVFLYYLEFILKIPPFYFAARKRRFHNGWYNTILSRSTEIVCHNSVCLAMYLTREQF